jgi:hypothetical protein
MLRRGEIERALVMRAHQKGGYMVIAYVVIRIYSFDLPRVGAHATRCGTTAIAISD